MTVLSADSKRLRRIAERELPNERLLWAGRPDPRATFVRASPIWLLGVPLTAGCVISALVAFEPVVSSGFKHGPGLREGAVFAVLGLPVLAIGLWMLGSPLWKAHRAHHTLHALTNRRLITLVDGRKTEIQSFNPAHIISLVRRSRGAGTGDLEIGFGSYRDSEGGIVERKELWIGIPNVAELERLLVTRPTDRD